MITYLETPPAVDTLDEQSRKACDELYPLIEMHCVPHSFDNGTDLLGVNDIAPIILIKKGIFKFFNGNRFVRLYHDRDLLFAWPSLHDESRCISEFGVEVITTDMTTLSNLAAAAPRIMQLILEITALQQRILQILCASHTVEDIIPEFTFRQFEPGVNIIIEGDPAQEIYMLVSGEASVTVEGVLVGSVRPGEVFGEISFFTSGKRSATVTTITPCLVQVMSREDFLALVKVRPSVNLAISKTLSERIIDTNRRITSGSKPVPPS